MGEEYRTLSSSLCSIFHSHITSSPLGSNSYCPTDTANIAIYRLAEDEPSVSKRVEDIVNIKILV
jgi:hypothetical protein